MKFYITNWDADVVEVGRTVLTVSSTVSYFTMHTINIPQFLQQCHIYFNCQNID